MKKRVGIVLLMLIIAVLAGSYFLLDPIDWIRNDRADLEKKAILAHFQKSSLNAKKETVAAPNPEAIDKNSITDQESVSVVKKQVLLDVQFIPQGPLDPGPAHWARHAESCEEAATLMAHNFAVGRTQTMQEAEHDIFAMVDWQKQFFGAEGDIRAEKVKQMLEQYWGHSDIRIINDISEQDIKRELSAGFPVIVPSIAKYLHNPRYYDRDYHMFLVVGYTPERFIAHDNGTTWGDNYPYPYKDLLQAVAAAGGDAVVIHS